jgi:hypothetical protein
MSSGPVTGVLCTNPFVTRLIRLQQDGKEAISGPANWREPPLLEVATESADDVDALITSMSPGGDENAVGRWHWLIGSPGNGKSAKLGFLARRLMERGYTIKSEDGVAIGERDAGWLPYLLEVREREKPYRFAYLVQDASVVRNPFGSVCDPAQDLADVLRLAAARGTSLLLCTNWGVLQRLFDLGHTNHEMREEPWFRAVSGAIGKGGDRVMVYAGGGTSGERKVFDRMEVTYEFLDNRSLLVNSDVFERLVEKATAEEQWAACADCPSASLCPFKANRDDLLVDALRGNVLDILRRAEVLDGQIIVFREAVALLSLLLAGCPNDHGGRTPCGWVHDQVRGDKVFSLLARRVPAIMFGATRPHGLEGADPQSPATTAIRRDQISALDSVKRLLDETSPVRRALVSVTRPGELSGDVGVERLLGPVGAVPALDPSLEPRHAIELDDFVAIVTSARSADEPRAGTAPVGIRAIEERCLRAWEEIFDAIAASGDPVTGQDLYFWARRWQTTCLAWIAAVARGITALQPELDNYLTFLNTSGELTERLATMRRLEEVLEKLLAPRDVRGGGGVHVELATSLWLTGRWAEAELRPQMEHDGGSNSNALYVKMSKFHPFVVTADSFSWLSRQHELSLSDLSFNSDVLETLRRTQAQAAAASDYSVENDNVTIVVIDEHGVEHRVERTRGFLLDAERL